MAAMIDLSHDIARGMGRLHREVDGRVVLMSVESGDIYELNELGRRIWSAIEHPIAVAALCDAIAAQTGAPIDTIRRDTLAFLNQLAAHNFVAIV